MIHFFLRTSPTSRVLVSVPNNALLSRVHDALTNRLGNDVRIDRFMTEEEWTAHTSPYSPLPIDCTRCYSLSAEEVC